MGSGADGKTVGKKKGDIRTLGQKPKKKAADFDVNNKPGPVKAEAVEEKGIAATYIKELIVELEEVREKYSALFAHPDLEVCSKTMQRLIDRLKAIS